MQLSEATAFTSAMKDRAGGHSTRASGQPCKPCGAAAPLHHDKGASCTKAHCMIPLAVAIYTCWCPCSVAVGAQRDGTTFFSLIMSVPAQLPHNLLWLVHDAMNPCNRHCACPSYLWPHAAILCVVSLHATHACNHYSSPITPVPFFTRRAAALQPGVPCHDRARFQPPQPHGVPGQGRRQPPAGAPPQGARHRHEPRGPPPRGPHQRRPPLVHPLGRVLQGQAHAAAQRRDQPLHPGSQGPAADRQVRQRQETPAVAGQPCWRQRRQQAQAAAGSSTGGSQEVSREPRNDTTTAGCLKPLVPCSGVRRRAASLCDMLCLTEQAAEMLRTGHLQLVCDPCCHPAAPAAYVHVMACAWQPIQVICTWKGS